MQVVPKTNWGCTALKIRVNCLMRKFSNISEESLFWSLLHTPVAATPAPFKSSHLSKVVQVLSSLATSLPFSISIPWDVFSVTWHMGINTDNEIVGLTFFPDASSCSKKEKKNQNLKSRVYILLQWILILQSVQLIAS